MGMLHLPELALSYEIAGQGIPLLFLHQVATDHRLWRRQRTFFRARYCPITVDVLGHGPVAWPPRERSMAQAARRVRQLLEHLGAGPAFVIGVSMGAAIAMGLALNAPALVRGLALVSPWSHPNDHLAPSLIIAGRSDLLTPPYLARAVARELADVEIEVWEETGHFPFLERPRRFNQRVEAFMRRCLAQAGPA